MKLIEKLPFRQELIDLIGQYGSIKTYPAGTPLVNDSCSEKDSLFILEGVIKLFIEHQNKKILLYHIGDNDVCILSYMDIFSDHPVQYSSVAVKDTTLLFIPNDKLLEWSKDYSELRTIIVSSYQKNYSCLLNTIKEFIGQSLESRLYSYLKLKSIHAKSLELKIPHNEIAMELNFSREAITRAIKKLEDEQKVIRRPRSIVLLENHIASA